MELRTTPRGAENPAFRKEHHSEFQQTIYAPKHHQATTGNNSDSNYSSIYSSHPSSSESSEYVTSGDSAMCDRKQYYRPNRFLPISSAAGGGVMSAPPSSVAPPASASLLTRQNLLTNLNFPHSHQATPTSQSHYLTTTPREATPLNNLSASSDATLICRPSPVAMMENNYTNGIPSQHLPGYGNGLTTPPALTGSCYYAHCHCCAPHFPASPPPSHCSASYHCHKHCASSETTSHTYATPVFPNDGFPPSGTTPLSQGSPSAPDRTSLWSLLRAWKTSWRAQAGFAKDAAAPSPPANGAARLPLWCLVLLVLVLAAAVCGTVVFFSVGGTGNSSPDAHRQSVIRTGQDPDTHPPNTKLRVFFGRFLILNRRFTSELNDTSSPEYIRMADNLASEVDVLLSSAPSFSHAAVTSLRSLDSLILVNFEFFLFAHLATQSSRAHLEEFGDLLIAGMRNHNGQMWLGGFQLDSRSVVLTEAPLDAIPSSDPQPVSALPAPPGWSAWSPWTKCDDHCIPGDKQERRRECRTNDGKGDLLQAKNCAGPALEIRSCRCSPRIMAAPMANGTEPVTASMDEVYQRACQKCSSSEVCIALLGSDVPSCVAPKNRDDPIGCGGLCNPGSEVCTKLVENVFRCVDATQCLKDEWKCSNGLCIPLEKRCDGHLNCYDHSDELNCECAPSEFQCGNRTSCLPPSKKCDGQVDCWDASDEQGCAAKLCPHWEFPCNNGQCIPQSKFCDKFQDCSDGSDEPAGCDGECRSLEWRCRNGRCIRNLTVCDGVNDCGDNSDETQCPSFPTLPYQGQEAKDCPEGKVACHNGECIVATARCDGKQDCTDNSDESRCRRPIDINIPKATRLLS